MFLGNIIGVGSGVGASNHDCAEGPLYIKQRFDQLQKASSNLAWETMLYPRKDIEEKADKIEDLCIRLAKKTCYLINNSKKCVVLGGDHSCAIGTWSGIAKGVKSKGDIGLIWVDAHMDAHTPKTTQSGNIHGMPVAVLLGRGHKSLTEIFSFSPKIKPQNICLVGVRDYELEEIHLLKSLDVKIYFMEQVKEQGINNILRECLSCVTKNTIGYGLSIDLDAFITEQAPGTGLPIKGGIDVKEFIKALTIFNNDSKLLCTEIVEYNPYLDKEDLTLNLILDILTQCAARQLSPERR